MFYKEWIGKNELKSEIINSNEPTIAVFAAKWCGYCTRFIDLIKSYELSTDAPGLAIVDTDSDDQSLWDEYRIQIVPTIVVFQKGKEIFRRNGRSMQGLNQGDLEAAIRETMEAKK